jgi:hypothetical protein
MGKAKGNDARTRLLGTMKWRTGAASIGDNTVQISMEEMIPSAALPKLTKPKYQLERNQR